MPLCPKPTIYPAGFSAHSLDTSNEEAPTKTTPTLISGMDCNSPEEWVFPKPVKATPTACVAPPPSLTSGEKWIFARLFNSDTESNKEEQEQTTVPDKTDSDPPEKAGSPSLQSPAEGRVSSEEMDEGTPTGDTGTGEAEVEVCLNKNQEASTLLCGSVQSQTDPSVSSIRRDSGVKASQATTRKTQPKPLLPRLSTR